MRLTYKIVFSAAVIAAAGSWYLHRTGRLQVPSQAQAVRFLPDGKKYNREQPSARSLIQKNIFSRMKLLGIPDSAAHVREMRNDSVVEIRIDLPQGRPLEWVLWNFSSSADGTPYSVADCRSPSGERGSSILFRSPGRGEPAVQVSFVRSASFFSKSAKMAVVVIDFGDIADSAIAADYLSFPEQLTLFVAPCGKHTQRNAELARRQGKECVIVIPMEPAPAIPKACLPFCIMIHFTEKKIRSILDDAESAVPGFSGFAAAGGGRALEDSRVADILFSEIKKRRGYFLETVAVPKSVVPVFGRKYGTPVAGVDRALDAAMSIAAVREALLQCAHEAEKRGTFIVSSRGTAGFIRGLKGELPELRRSGICLSNVSDIVMPQKGKKQASKP